MRFLQESALWYQWNKTSLATLLRQPDGVLLLLDGLDEIFDLDIRDGVLNDIARFTQDHPSVPVVVTSRVVGYKPPRLRHAEFRHFMLQDLSAGDGKPGQIDEFLDRWHAATFDDPAAAETKRERLRRAIRESKAIAELAGNPLLLTMMAILNRNQELPRDRAELYNQASRVLLHQWDTERALVEFPGLRSDIGLREKIEILRRVANDMQTAPSGLAGNIIDGATLTGLIETYLSDELHFQPARAAARAVVEQLRLRNFILCFLGGDSYAFVHRTFLEYFCAADIVHRFNIAKSLSIDELIALFDTHALDDDWREVLRLICGQIDEQFVGRIVEYLVTRIEKTGMDQEASGRIVPLAIWCLSEPRNLGRLDVVGARLLQFVASSILQPDERQPRSRLENILIAAKDLGSRWPGKSGFNRPERYPHKALHPWSRDWPRFVLAVFDERGWIEELTTCEDPLMRDGAIELLAARWPDDRARRFIVRRITIDADADRVDRVFALRALSKTWRDEETRRLLMELGAQDRHEEVQFQALSALTDEWPDERVRQLCYTFAVSATQPENRKSMLRRLVRGWPGGETRAFVANRGRRDGAAAAFLCEGRSELGRISFSQDVDGLPGYLDPRQPVFRRHIEKAAAKANMSPSDIDGAIRSVSEYVGWDVTKGSGAPPDPEPETTSTSV